MTAPFQPTTAYLDDWRHFDDSELADWLPDNQGLTKTHRLWREPIREGVVIRGQITQPEFVPLTVGVGVTSATAAFLFANPTDQDFNPQPNDVIALDSGERWTITRFSAAPPGSPWWPMLCEPERQNV